MSGEKTIMHLQTKIVHTLVYVYYSMLIVDAEQRVCDVILFNTSTQLCCGGKLFPLLDQHNQRQSCCLQFVNSTIDGRLYNEDTHFCCDIIRPKHDGDGKEWDCCDGTPYQKAENICCGKQLRKFDSKDADTACCDGKFYNSTSEVCCRSTLHRREKDPLLEDHLECCGEKRYDVRNQVCHHSSEDNPKLLFVTLEYCNGQEYNTTTHICCDNKITQIPELHERHNYRCCGDKAFKTTEMNCCNNNYLIPESRECCGKGSFDPDHQRCCSGVPNNISTIQEKSKCCGTKLISAHDICCNGIHGDLNFQCCDGVSLISKSDTCCEGQVLEASKICCTEKNGATKQIDKRKVGDNACCTYRKHHIQVYEPYDSMYETCHKGVYGKKTTTNQAREIVSSTTQIPTSGKLKTGDFQANNNVVCSREMNFKDFRVIKTKHGNGNLILRVQLERNLQAGERRKFQVILKERIHIQEGKMYRIYTTHKIGFTRKFYKSGKDVLIRRNKKNIRRFEKLCKVKSILERSLPHI